MDRDPAAVALTFDDGPDRRGTPRVLDALRAAAAHATFFVIAPRAESEPALIARIEAEGHTIGLHCDAHVRHTECTRAEVAADTERALGRLRRLGITPTLWRTPWGASAGFTDDIADDFGLALVGWDVDTHDWRGDTAVTIHAATRDAIGPGTTVLAHDGIGPGARRSNCRHTAAWVQLAAAVARIRGLPLAALTRRCHTMRARPA